MGKNTFIDASSSQSVNGVAPSKNPFRKRDSLEKGEAMPFLGKLLKSIPEVFNEIEFRPVKNVEEFKKATHLVYHDYLSLNYIKPNRSELKLSLYSVLPSTTTLVAIYKKTHVLATLTLAEDSPLGLPMDEIYNLELNELRSKGRRIFEATMFAVDGRATGPNGVLHLSNAKKLQLILYLFRYGFDFLRSCRDVNELVGCFHPRHEILYKFIQMEPLGGLKHYDSVRGNPAVARHMDMDSAQAQVASIPVMNFLFGHTSPSASQYEGRLQFSKDDIRALFIESENILSQARSEDLAYIKGCYPGYDFGEIMKKESAWPLLRWLKNPFKKLHVFSKGAMPKRYVSLARKNITP